MIIPLEIFHYRYEERYDYQEDFYHAFLAGIFNGAGYMVESNREHGEGRSDVVVKDLRHGGGVLESLFIRGAVW